jgi:hypothetical protein
VCSALIDKKIAAYKAADGGYWNPQQKLFHERG